METPATYALRLERRIAAPREAVFKAWTEAATLVKWFAPPAGAACEILALEPRPGGKFWVDMATPDGMQHQLRCTFEEVRSPERLVLRWAWDSSPGSGITRVVVTLHDDGGATNLVLVHEGFPKEGARASHEQGWNGSLPRLVSLFAS